MLVDMSPVETPMIRSALPSLVHTSHLKRNSVQPKVEYEAQQSIRSSLKVSVEKSKTERTFHIFHIYIVESQPTLRIF